MHLCLYHLETRSSVKLLDAAQIYDLKISDDGTQLTFIDRKNYEQHPRSFRIIDLREQAQFARQTKELKS